MSNQLVYLFPAAWESKGIFAHILVTQRAWVPIWGFLAMFHLLLLSHLVLTPEMKGVIQKAILGICHFLCSSKSSKMPNMQVAFLEHVQP
jgi:hypothetical protein